MKKFTKLFSILLTAMILLTSFPIQAKADDYYDDKLNKTKVTLAVSETTSLTIINDAFGYKKVPMWAQSSDPSVATVSSSGKVTAQKAGSATITVKSFTGEKFKCKVTVKNPFLDCTKKTIYIGAPYTLKLRGTEIKSVKSSNTKVAKVSKTGKVTGKKVGTATITLKGINGKNYKCKVTIKKPYINATKKTIFIGKPYVLKLKGTEIKKVKSGNKKIATVDKSGRVVGKKAGKTTISITGKNGKTYKCKVTIKKLANSYDGYDQWGNGYVKEGPDRIYSCDFPVPLLDIDQMYEDPLHGKTYGFFYADSKSDSDEWWKAYGDAEAKYQEPGTGKVIGYYNGVKIYFCCFK